MPCNIFEVFGVCRIRRKQKEAPEYFQIYMHKVLSANDLWMRFRSWMISIEVFDEPVKGSSECYWPAEKRLQSIETLLSDALELPEEMTQRNP